MNVRIFLKYTSDYWTVKMEYDTWKCWLSELGSQSVNSLSFSQSISRSVGQAGRQADRHSKSELVQLRQNFLNKMRIN
jgi:hypothetical protein